MRLTRVGCAVGGAVLALPLASTSPAAAAEGQPCSGVDPDTEPSAATGRSIPYDLLDVDRATQLLERRGTTPGEGVKVAVVDSGVYAGDDAMAPLTVVDALRFGTNEPLVYGHGTNIAGLVAGGARDDGKPTGIAPGAEIVDLRVYDQAGDNGVGGIPQPEVIDAVTWLAANAEDQQIGVVVMAFSIDPSPALQEAISVLSAQDVVIVAASGNRPTEDGQEGLDRYGEQAPGEDAARLTYPAGYAEDVFAVTTTAAGIPVAEDEVPDASGVALRSSAIDAAVPTYGAITLAPNGATCLVDEIATSWAAGVGAGVVALLRSAYPQDNATQIEARLIATASGSSVRPNTATGHGVLQPVEALTRDLAPSKDGEFDDMPRADTSQPPVTGPVPETDPLAATLADARWWGLFAGAGLVVALLLRPLLRRRST